MMLPPTSLPPGLRMFVDPPPRFSPVFDTPPELVPSPRWSRLRSILAWSRRRRTPADGPCGEVIADHVLG